VSVEFDLLNRLVRAYYQADDLYFYELRLREYRAVGGAFFTAPGEISGNPDPLPEEAVIKSWLPKNLHMRCIDIVVDDVDEYDEPQPGPGRWFQIPIASRTRWEQFQTQTDAFIYNGLVCTPVRKHPEWYAWL